MTLELAVLGTLVALIVLARVRSNRQLRQVAEERETERVPLVRPPSYIGPQTFTHSPEGTPYNREVPCLNGIPKAHLRWANLLFWNTNLDNGAGYFHNVGHRSLVLHTNLTTGELVEAIKSQTGIEGVAHENRSGSSVYRWVEFNYRTDKARELGVYPYYHFTIEVRSLY